MENVITFIGLLFCHPSSLSFGKLQKTRNDLARPVMGTIFLVNRSILSYGVQLSYTLEAAHMISSRLPGRSLRFR